MIPFSLLWLLVCLFHVQILVHEEITFQHANEWNIEMLKNGPVVCHCAPDVMSHYYCYSQKVHFLYISKAHEHLSLLNVSEYQLYSYIAFVCLCHHWVTWGKNWKMLIYAETLFMWGASYVLSLLRSPVEWWRPPEFQGCCGFDQIVLCSHFCYHPRLLSSSSLAAAAYFHSQMRLLQ